LRFHHQNAPAAVYIQSSELTGSAREDDMRKNRPATFSDYEVRVRAYKIWERNGKPEGRAEEHWRQALKELQAEAAAKAAPPSVPARLEVSNPPVRIAPPESSPESEAA
jgi:hypothetical protein